MASGMFKHGKVELMRGNIDLINDAISVVLVDLSLYAPDLDNDEAQADIPEAARLSEVLVTGKSLDGTKLLASDAVFNSLSSALNPVGGVVLFKDSGVYSTSTLIAYFDNAPEFPITPDDSDVVIAWANGLVLEL